MGQEDAQTADFHALRSAGIYYGISTHDEAELETALALKPNYIAIGPFSPHTPKRFMATARFRNRKKLAETNKITISRHRRLKLENAASVFQAGADSIAVISDVTAAENPEQRAKDWLQASQNWQR